MRIVDLFGREYGWSKSDTEDLTVSEINFLIASIKKHYKNQR
jgi:hypothetical protein